MSWAADPKTTRPEDVAYCLMGLFGVNMPMLYGERGDYKGVRRLVPFCLGRPLGINRDLLQPAGDVAPKLRLFQLHHAVPGLGAAAALQHEQSWPAHRPAAHSPG